ncbi:hypothetical protein H4217_009009, partial [Coemansia sp. RSA 1939]
MSYQKDFDSVKTKLRDLWSQYGASSGSSGSSGSNDVGTRSGSTQKAAAAASAAPPAPVEEVLLFPTYAYRDEQLK